MVPSSETEKNAAPLRAGGGHLERRAGQLAGPKIETARPSGSCLGRRRGGPRRLVSGLALQDANGPAIVQGRQAHAIWPREHEAVAIREK